eukprot:scaffold39975_cov26-Tisochrysis_lutea.AAC.1
MTDLHCLHPCNASIHGWHALSHAQLHVHEPLPVAGMHSFARSCMCMSLDLSMSLYPWLACSQSCTAARASVPVPVQQTHSFNHGFGCRDIDMTGTCKNGADGAQGGVWPHTLQWCIDGTLHALNAKHGLKTVNARSGCWSA